MTLAGREFSKSGLKWAHFCLDWRYFYIQETPSGDGVHSLTLTYQHLLLKAANHIALLLPHLTQSEKQHKHSKRICQQVFEKHQQFVKQTQEASFRTLSDPKYCGKMKVTFLTVIEI